MNILPLPAFTDNYIWLIEENGKATVVDPGDAEVVNNCLKEKNLELENILITHHHFDHTGGVEQLKKSHECNVYGPHDSPFNGVEIKLKENDEISKDCINGCRPLSCCYAHYGWIYLKQRTKNTFVPSCKT